MRTFGFRLASVQVEGGRKEVARFTCNHCDAVLDVPRGSGNVNPEAVAKRAARGGWKTDAFNITRCVCPNCQRKKSVDPDAELKKVVPMTITSVPIREPTKEQRQQIRSHLDKSFDDAAGYYLDDMSDQRIAELVGVPRIVVETVREAAYGPIRVSPELIALRGELAGLKTKIEDGLKSLRALEAKATEIGSRVEKMIAGRAAA